MAKLSAGLSRTVAHIVADTLRRQPGSKNGRANVRAAAKKAGASEAERRMLNSLASGWREGRRLQEGAFQSVARIVARLDPAAAKKLRELFWTTEGERALAATLMSSDWIEPASSWELARLLRSPEEHLESIPREVWTFVKGQSQQIPAIRGDATIAKLIADFQAWAARKGHSRWIVQGSLRRALGPIVAHAATRGLLLQWSELSPGQRREFVRVGLARERIILGTQPAHMRAMERFASPAALRAPRARRKADAQPAGPQPTQARCEECMRPYRVPKGRPPACPHCRAIPRFVS